MDADIIFGTRQGYISCSFLGVCRYTESVQQEKNVVKFFALGVVNGRDKDGLTVFVKKVFEFRFTDKYLKVRNVLPFGIGRFKISNNIADDIQLVTVLV